MTVRVGISHTGQILRPKLWDQGRQPSVFAVNFMAWISSLARPSLRYSNSNTIIHGPRTSRGSNKAIVSNASELTLEPRYLRLATPQSVQYQSRPLLHIRCETKSAVRAPRHS
jgi:hypothetical protein